MRIDPDFDRRRPGGDGRAFVYVLPLQVDELLKLGFSRDPLSRMQSLHPRYFDFFDLERVQFVQADRVRDARRLESDLKRLLHEHRAHAPIEVRAQAGGDTEWYRGAYALLQDAVNELSARGYQVHFPGSAWLREQLLSRSAVLFEWSAQVFEQMQLARGAAELAVRDQLGATLRDALDALVAFDIDIAGVVPADVAGWFLHPQRRQHEGGS